MKEAGGELINKLPISQEKIEPQNAINAQESMEYHHEGRKIILELLAAKREPINASDASFFPLNPLWSLTKKELQELLDRVDEIYEQGQDAIQKAPEFLWQRASAFARMHYLNNLKNAVPEEMGEKLTEAELEKEALVQEVMTAVPEHLRSVLTRSEWKGFMDVVEMERISGAWTEQDEEWEDLMGRLEEVLYEAYQDMTEKGLDVYLSFKDKIPEEMVEDYGRFAPVYGGEYGRDADVDDPEDMANELYYHYLKEFFQATALSQDESEEIFDTRFSKKQLIELVEMRLHNPSIVEETLARGVAKRGDYSDEEITQQIETHDNAGLTEEMQIKSALRWTDARRNELLSIQRVINKQRQSVHLGIVGISMDDIVLLDEHDFAKVYYLRGGKDVNPETLPAGFARYNKIFILDEHELSDQLHFETTDGDVQEELKEFAKYKAPLAIDRFKSVLSHELVHLGSYKKFFVNKKGDVDAYRYGAEGVAKRTRSGLFFDGMNEIFTEYLARKITRRDVGGRISSFGKWKEAIRVGEPYSYYQLVDLLHDLLDKKHIDFTQEEIAKVMYRGNIFEFCKKIKNGMNKQLFHAIIRLGSKSDTEAFRKRYQVPDREAIDRLYDESSEDDNGEDNED